MSPSNIFRSAAGRLPLLPPEGRRPLPRTSRMPPDPPGRVERDGQARRRRGDVATKQLLNLLTHNPRVEPPTGDDPDGPAITANLFYAKPVQTPRPRFAQPVF